MSTTKIPHAIDSQPRRSFEASPEPLRELDRRTHDGIDVSMLWNPRTDGIAIHVVDARTGESLAFEVDGTEALDAFHHPYAYMSPRAGGALPQPLRPLRRDA